MAPTQLPVPPISTTSALASFALLFKNYNLLLSTGFLPTGDKLPELSHVLRQGATRGRCRPGATCGAHLWAGEKGRSRHQGNNSRGFFLSLRPPHFPFSTCSEGPHGKIKKVQQDVKQPLQCFAVFYKQEELPYCYHVSHKRVQSVLS